MPTFPMPPEAHTEVPDPQFPSGTKVQHITGGYALAVEQAVPQLDSTTGEFVRFDYVVSWVDNAFKHHRETYPGEVLRLSDR